MAISPIGAPLPLQLQTNGASKTSGGTGFANFLEQALSGVNGDVSQAASQGLQLADGTSTSVANAMISATQAQLALDMTVQVRNRVVDAYNTLMNMQV
ncbi:MAG: flagellar hook-basal body complex protein FliE [Firmicutes bacterium]|nr:flagellar hook-basal body complex protein FliE [Bacillota bacterium]